MTGSSFAVGTPAAEVSAAAGPGPTAPYLVDPLAPAPHRVSERGRPARSILTWRGRRGRMSATKWRALEEILPRFDIGLAAPTYGSPIDHSTVPRLTIGSRQLVLEVGSGMGDATLELASRQPELDVIACEPHLAGVARLCRILADEGIGNVRIHPGDALDVLDALPDQSLTVLRAFFPDPWPRNRHHIKRLVQPSFEKTAGRVLVPGGVVHLATDVDDYAVQMGEVFGQWAVVEPPFRPETKFERIGREAGRTIVDLAYRRHP